MSIHDDARADLADLLNTEDFGRSALFNGVEIVLILKREFKGVDFEQGSVESFDFRAWGAKSDLEGLNHGDPIHVMNEDEVYEPYYVVGIQEQEAGLMLLFLSKEEVV